MESRSSILRRRNRRVYGWSFAAAVLIHVVVLAVGPWFRTDPMSGARTELVANDPANLSGIPLELFFGPPAILIEGDSVSQEPPDRFLHAKRLVAPPYGCALDELSEAGPVRGVVRLRLDDRGRVDEVGVVEETGVGCGTVLMERVAGDLLYHWLPSERFPAPVELFQPVTVTLSDR